MTIEKNKNRAMLLASVCIFGTIGVLRRYIPLSSSLIALVRGVVGSLFLIVIQRFNQKSINRQAVKRNLFLLALSGTGIGFNWILLFEAYNYTSVAIATLCYYLAPILVILASPFVLKEVLTRRKFFCAMIALIGMVLVSDILNTSFSGIAELQGILFGLGAAVLYASVILMNKKIVGVPAYDKTIVQLAMASIALFPYVLFTEEWTSVTISASSVALLLAAGIVHTGIAYWMYFGSMEHLPSHTVALLSYLDPILAILLSMVFLREPMSMEAAIGAVMILGAAYISEKQ